MNYLVAMVLLCLPLVDCRCNLPPSLWCSSVETAKQCNVQTQCESYMGRRVKAGPVNLELYFETECGSCKQFISSQLYSTWKTLGSDILNVTLIPYGNAEEKKTIFGDWKFTCQHGEDECLGNFIETCAISLLKNITTYFPFIYCIEKDQWGVPGKDAPKCAKQLGIDYSPILSCANGKTGAILEHEMALLTEALDPPHKYVPWVVLNGVHTEELNNQAMMDLLNLVCETYQGPTPEACQTERCLKEY